VSWDFHAAAQFFWDWICLATPYGAWPRLLPEGAPLGGRSLLLLRRGAMKTSQDWSLVRKTDFVKKVRMLHDVCLTQCLVWCPLMDLLTPLVANALSYCCPLCCLR
jgi:hypothetical protein